MKKRNIFSAAIMVVVLIMSSFVQGQSCDTLRNYNPTDSYYEFSSTNGLMLGQDEFTAGSDTYQVQAWSEPYTAPTLTEVRAIRVAPWKVQDNSGNGSVTFHVYADNAGDPSATILASEIVSFSDITVNRWNTISFTNPPSVNGSFHVGYELNYTSPVDSFALLGTQPATSVTKFQLSGSGALNDQWLDLSSGYSLNTAFLMDVLLSTGVAPTADYLVTNVAACVGGSIGVDASISTGTIDTYNWSLTDNPYTQDYVEFDGAETDVISPTVATGAQQAIYLITYGACDYDIVGYLVDVYSEVNATVNPTDALCGNATGSIIVSGVTGGNGSYLYSIDGGTNTSPTPNFSNLAAGTYDVTITSNGDGCSYAETITITDTPGEILSVGGGQTICAGSSANLTASGNGTIEWFEGATSIGTGATMSVSPTATTTYDVVLTDANGCTDTKQIDVVVTPLEDASFTYASNTICLGGGNETPTSVATTGGTFTASSSDLVFANSSTGEIDMASSLEGTYDVTYTTAGTCAGTEVQSLTITTAPDASFTYANTEYCNNEGTVAPTFPTGASAGTFTSTAGLVIASGTGVIDLASSTPGVYVVTNTIAASGSCAASSETFSITVKETPTVDAGADQAVCEGTDVTLTATGADTYVWNNGITQGTPFTPTTTTTYTVSVDNNGCTATDEVVVTVNPLPTVDAGADQTACTNHSAIALAGTPAGGTFSGNGVSNNEFDPATAGVGTHTVTYTYADGNGCENTATLTVTVDGCVSVEENVMNQLTVSPNPSSDYIEVRVNENNSIQNIQVMSLDGKVVSVEQNVVDHATIKIDVSSVAKGTYLIQLSTEYGFLTRKIVVQ